VVGRPIFIAGVVAAAILAGSVLPQSVSGRSLARTTSLYLGAKRVSVMYPDSNYFEVPVSSGAGDTTWVSVGHGIVWVTDPGAIGADEHIGYARKSPRGFWYVNVWTFDLHQPVVTIGTVHRSSTGHWDAYCGLGRRARHYGYATGPHPALGAVALLVLFGSCS
jgi:hypothetical protein